MKKVGDIFSSDLKYYMKVSLFCTDFRMAHHSYNHYLSAHWKVVASISFFVTVISYVNNHWIFMFDNGNSQTFLSFLITLCKT